MADSAYLRAMHARAVAQGDVAQARALEADLERTGASSTPGRSYGLETAVVPMPDAAVPPVKRAGRPPKPRCEHGQIVGRCLDCDEAA